MAAGLFIPYLRTGFRRARRRFRVSGHWPPFFGDQQLVDLRQLLRQQAIKSIFQTTGPWPI
jgi:hypothetical protein